MGILSKRDQDTQKMRVFFCLMKYSEELTAEICKYISAGNTQKDAAILADISEETFYQWQRPLNKDGTVNADFHAEFTESLKKAEQQCKARNIAFVQKAAEKSWQAAAWYLERKYHNEYALKNINELQGANGEPFKLNIITGADYVSALGKTTSTSAASFTGGPSEVQGVDLASESPQDDNSDKPVSEVEST